MIRFFLGAVLTLLSSAASATAAFEICAGAPDSGYLECPSLITSTGSAGTPDASGVEITGITQDSAVTADNPYRVLVHDCTAETFTDADRFDINLDQRSVSVTTDGTIDIDWAPENTANLCATYLHYAKSIEGNVETEGPFATVVETAQTIRWRPGIYGVGDWMITASGERRLQIDYATAYDRIKNSGECTGGQFDGFGYKINWAALRPVKDQPMVWTVLDAFHDVMDNGDCATGPKALGVIMDTHTGGKDAGGTSLNANKQTCAPTGYDIGTAGADVMLWTAGDREVPQCSPRFWETNAAVSTIKDDIEADCGAIVERYGSRPYLEYVGCQGEASLGSPGNSEVVPSGGTAFTATGSLAVEKAMALNIQAINPEIWHLLAVNNHGGNATWQSEVDDIQAFMEANPGIGFRCPDEFAWSTASLPRPRTDWDKMMAGQNWHGKTLNACDNQNPGTSRYPTTNLGVGQLLDSMFMAVFTSTPPNGHWDSSLTYPAGGTNETNATSHPRIGFGPNQPESIFLTELDADGWKAASDWLGCPSIITDAGWACVDTPL